jgi:hypothetical protein
MRQRRTGLDHSVADQERGLGQPMECGFRRLAWVLLCTAFALSEVAEEIPQHPHSVYTAIDEVDAVDTQDAFFFFDWLPKKYGKKKDTSSPMNRPTKEVWLPPTKEARPRPTKWAYDLLAC